MKTKYITLGINNIRPSFEEKLEVVKKDQVLQHVEEFKLEDINTFNFKSLMKRLKKRKLS